MEPRSQFILNIAGGPYAKDFMSPPSALTLLVVLGLSLRVSIKTNGT